MRYTFENYDYFERNADSGVISIVRQDAYLRLFQNVRSPEPHVLLELDAARPSLAIAGG